MERSVIRPGVPKAHAHASLRILAAWGTVHVGTVPDLRVPAGLVSRVPLAAQVGPNCALNYSSGSQADRRREHAPLG